MNEPTQKQRDVLDFIATELTVTGICPSFREIGQAMGIASTYGVSQHVQALIRKGLLEHTEGQVRALRLTDAGRAAARYNGARVLGAVSGLGPAAVTQTLARVRANQALLDGCAGPHDFPEPAEHLLGARLLCTRCGGELRAIEARWYRRGLEHGRRS